MRATSNKLVVIAHGDREIRIIRTFNAPRRLVAARLRNRPATRRIVSLCLEEH